MANKIEHLYEQSKDLHIRNYIVYADTTKNYVYADAACTTGKELTKDELIEAFKKNVLVKIGSDFYAPTQLDIDTTYASLIMLDVSATSPAKMVKYSKEYAG